MENISKEQLKKLHVLLNKLALARQKEAMVFEVSKGRTTSSKELTKAEATILISFLSKQDITFNDSDYRMKRKVYALAREAGIIYGYSDEDNKMNTAKLNSFLKEKGAVRKELNQMSHKELIRTVNQFMLIVQHKKESTARSETNKLLNELNIGSMLPKRS